jgi:hypothetical protein
MAAIRRTRSEAYTGWLPNRRPTNLAPSPFGSPEQIKGRRPVASGKHCTLLYFRCGTDSLFQRHASGAKGCG